MPFFCKHGKYFSNSVKYIIYNCFITRIFVIYDVEYLDDIYLNHYYMKTDAGMIRNLWNTIFILQ